MALSSPKAPLSAALAASACALLLAPAGLHAKVKKQTFTYKTVKKLTLKADVYREADGKKRAVVVLVQGGALISGHREQVPRRLKDDTLKAGYVLVSIGYRLAPESKLPDVVGDVSDAVKWVHDKGPKLFKADPDRIAVAGGSAGGCLAVNSG